jgi:hypothetical protein
MKKLILGLIVATAMAVLATPAFAIHHGTNLGNFVPICAQSNGSSNSIGGNEAADEHANRAANSRGLTHNDASPNCHGLVNNT